MYVLRTHSIDYIEYYIIMYRPIETIAYNNYNYFNGKYKTNKSINTLQLFFNNINIFCLLSNQKTLVFTLA